MKTKSFFSAARLPTAAIAAALIGASILWNGCESTEPTPADPKDNVLINIQSPRGGDVFKVGDTLTVKWTIKTETTDPIQAVDILISPDSVNWAYLRNSSFYPADPGFGTYKWKIKDTVSDVGVKYALAGSKKCHIRIEDYAYPRDVLKNRTTAAFTINP